MWVLVGILVAAQGVAVQPISLHGAMDDCFDARELVLTQMPTPKINYELVCVKTDQVTGI